MERTRPLFFLKKLNVNFTRKIWRISKKKKRKSCMGPQFVYIQQVCEADSTEGCVTWRSLYLS